LPCSRGGSYPAARYISVNLLLGGRDGAVVRLARLFLVADTNESDVREPIERQQRADVGLEGRTRIIGSSRQHSRVTRGNQHHDRLGCEQRPVGVFGFSGESERTPD